MNAHTPSGFSLKCTILRAIIGFYSESGDTPEAKAEVRRALAELAGIEFSTIRAARERGAAIEEHAIEIVREAETHHRAQLLTKATGNGR